MAELELLERPPAYEPRHALPDEPRRDRTAIILIVVLLLTTTFVAGTTATFNASTSNPDNRFAMAALDPPTNPSVSMVGKLARFSWFTVTGPNNDGAGYRLAWKDVGPPSAAGLPAPCSNTADSLYEGSDTNLGGFVADVMTPPYDDAQADIRARGGGATARPGRYICYRVQTLYPPEPAVGQTPWTSQGQTVHAAVQTGFVVATVTLDHTSGSVLNSLDQGDVITITFNQPVNTATGPAETGTAYSSTQTICTEPVDPEEIIIGSVPTLSTDQCDPVVDVPLVGRLKDASGSTNRMARDRRFAVKWNWTTCPATNQCGTLTATLGSQLRLTTTHDVPVLSSDPWTLTPVGTLQTPAYDATTNPARTLCTVNPTGGLCVPQTSGSF